MRILFITQGFPEPRMIGGQIASYYSVVQLTRAGHAVTCLCQVTSGPAPTGDAAISEIAQVTSVESVPANSLLRYALSVVDPLPWPIRRYASARAREMVRRTLEAGPFDIILFNSIHSATLLKTVRENTDAPCILFAHNVQSMIMELFARFQSGPPRRVYARLQWQRMLSFEERSLPQFDAVCAFSREDAEQLVAIAPGAKVEVCPMALDIISMRDAADGVRASKASAPDTDGSSTFASDIVFVSYLGWRPNQDSLRWFVDEILPLIRKERPSTTLTIVGAGGPPWIEGLADERTHVAGTVEDITPYVSLAKVFVVPLRIGSGVRVKIIQALAMRTAVVSTSKGCEGLELDDGTHLLVGDTPAAFAGAVLQLLEDPTRRKALASAGHSVVADRFDALSSSSRLAEICERVAVGSPGRDTE
ncbi:glycosyltransferase [bacterium]|nr:glycosyltransferase [bacterium]